LLYVSSTEAFLEEFVVPIRRLLLARTAITKTIAYCGLHWLAATPWLVFLDVGFGLSTTPGGLRVIHPPAASIDVKGKRLNLEEVAVKSAPRRYRAPGGEYGTGTAGYYKNCFFCHGDALNGNGHYAKGFNPPPANFQDPARLPSYQNPSCSGVLPRAGQDARRLDTVGSAMPVWENMLTENESGRWSCIYTRRLGISHA